MKRELNKAMTALESNAEIIADLVEDISLDDCADYGAELKRAIDKANKALSIIKSRIVESGEDEFKGVDFRAVVTRTVRWSLDTKSVRQEMGDEWCDAHCRQSVVNSVTFKV